MTMRMVRSTMHFGRLDLEGSCQGVPISVHTDYGLGRKLEPETLYQLSFELSWDSSYASVITHGPPLSVGIFTVKESTTSPNDISVELYDGTMYQKASGGSISITDYSDIGTTGSFNLSFSDGSNLTGSFNHLIFGSGSGQTSVQGTWQGNPVSGSTSNAYSWLNTFTSKGFVLSYADNTQQISLFCMVSGDWTARTYQMPMEAWVDLGLNIETNPPVQGYTASGTLNIATYSADHKEGSMTVNFSEGGTMTGSFNVSLVEFGF